MESLIKNERVNLDLNPTQMLKVNKAVHKQTTYKTTMNASNI